MYAYSNSDRENDDHALPNIEVFFLKKATILVCDMRDEDGDFLGEGYYWRAGFPGCLPDGEPNGPFATQADALADARED